MKRLAEDEEVNFFRRSICREGPAANEEKFYLQKTSGEQP